LLSYRHSFHAGNFADVLKHIVLVEILEHLTAKEKAFEYIDSHAGAGLFDLSHGHAEKLGEYRNGIGRLWGGDWKELHSYFDIIRAFNSSPSSLIYYPGSPLIATQFLRPRDRAWQFELHPTDFRRLEKNTRDYRNVRVSCQDGHQGLLGVLPPASRRGLVFIDPAYEIKTEYEQVFKTVKKAHRKFSTGVFAIWYPVVDRSRLLLEHHPLRAYDAVQLASALQANDALQAANLPALTFLAADVQLLTAAQAEGLTTDNPNDHPDQQR